MVDLSIIIPVYNVEQYLENCLNSILNGNLKNIELICINDGSTDNSLNILNNYAEKYNNIKVISQQNQGQGVARNLGIEIAQGEYIGFVDPDDWVEPEMFERMYNQAKKFDLDIITCNRKCHFQDKIKYKNDWKKIKGNYTNIKKQKVTNIRPNNNLTYQDIQQTLLVSFCFCWNKIFKASLIKDYNIKFSSTRLSEDVIFILKAFLYAKKISYLNEYLYNYRESSQSISHKITDYAFDEFQVIQELEEFFNNNPQYKNFLYENYQFYKLFSLTHKYNQVSKNKQKLFLLKAKNILNQKEYLLLLKKNKLWLELIKELFL